MSLKLDVLVATYQRPHMLARALESLLDAPAPVGLNVHVTVIDNDHSEATGHVIERYIPRFDGRLAHVSEHRRGKSHALNNGIEHTSGDLIGFIDDDEEVDTGWYTQIVHAFRDERVGFIGGPCLPRWGAVPPAWLPATFRGVIGYVDDGDRVMVFGKDAPGILMGGNAVIRRRVLERAGPFAPQLGPTGDRRLMSGEDEELFSRLLRADALGLYVPDLKIYHYVPAERLTKRYFRRWCFWHGVSSSVIERLRPSPVRRVGRIPRYVVGSAARGLAQLVGGARAVDPSRRFASELSMWQLAGFVYGAYWYEPEPRA